MPRQLDPKLRVLFDQIPGCWGCKDENSVFIYCNETYAELVGVKSAFDLIGRTAFDLPCDAAECAPLFQAQDKEVMASAKPLKILDIHPFAGGEWRAFDVTKMPLFDEERNIIGTIFYGRDITSSRSLELATLLARMHVGGKPIDLVKQGSYLIDNSVRGKAQLNRREAEVLFLLLRSKTVKAIASILNLADRTIHQHVATLKSKFSVSNRLELVERAIELGHLNYIPPTLFSKQLSLVLRTE